MIGKKMDRRSLHPTTLHPTLAHLATNVMLFFEPVTVLELAMFSRSLSLPIKVLVDAFIVMTLRLP